MSFFSFAFLLFIFCLQKPLKDSGLLEVVRTTYPETTQADFNFIILVTISIFLSKVSCFITNELRLFLYSHTNNDKRPREDRLNELSIDCKKDCADSEIVRNIYDVAKNEDTVLITLDNRKAYVCIVNKFMQENDSPEHKEVTIIPIISGYRDVSDLIKILKEKGYESKLIPNHLIACCTSR